MVQIAGEIYFCGIFVEHSHGIFLVYSEKIPYEILGNIPNNAEIFPVPWIDNECYIHFLGGSRNAITALPSG